MTESYVRELWEKYQADNLTQEEFTLLWKSMQEPAYKELWMEWMGEVWKNPALHGLSDPASAKLALDRIIGEGAVETEKETGVYPIRGSRQKWWWAAAAAVLVLAGGAWWFSHTGRGDRERIARQLGVTRDVAPGVDAAVLTLSDGRQIVLDSTENGKIGQEGQSVITRNRGAVVYDRRQQGDGGRELLNTLATQKGNRYQLTLSDGTRVWLNAASSIRYPTDFSGRERRVTVTGEAYFEVAPDPGKPFLVEAGNALIDVLGTAFNINAYTDEGKIRTTLVEGKVRVRTKDGSGGDAGNSGSAGNDGLHGNGGSAGSVSGTGNAEILKPGEDAVLERDGKVKTEAGADLTRILAWKENLFMFSDDDIGSVMRQLSRWYKVDVKYEGAVQSLHFSGIISRNTPLSEVLKLLRESTDKVGFLVVGDTLIVSAQGK